MRLQERTAEPDVQTATPRRISAIGRVLVLLGAALLALAAFLPWVVVEGIPLNLDWLDVSVPVEGQEVAGTDTVVWPYLLGFAVLVALLGLFARARWLLLVLALAALAGAGALLYYLSNVIDIETSGRTDVEQTLADVGVRAAVQSGPYALLAGALLTMAGALTRRKPPRVLEPFPPVGPPPASAGWGPGQAQ